jgi:glycosyltransferase involved in cell wall biosynthesis
MKISIIVPAYNEEKLITSTLRSILAAMAAFEEANWESELIVCDNNSTDRTAELARAEGANVVFEPINQIGRARNCGAAAASGDWLIFIDADSHPSRDLFADVRETIRSGDCFAGGSTVTLDGRHPIARWLIVGWNLLSRCRNLMAGSFIFCERKTFEEIDGFSEHLFASEEIDLSIRLKKIARARKQRVVILHRHPLLTSGRKMHLYSKREYLRFLAKTILRNGAPLRSREECFAWYDGRR